MITRTEDLRPGLYRANRAGVGFWGFWHELTILPYPPDPLGHVLFTVRDLEGRLGYGIMSIHNSTPHLHYPKVDPIPVDLEPMDTPAASISHVRRVEL